MRTNLKNSKILIVDDKQSNVDLLTDFLEVSGYTNISSITDSRLAIGAFESFKPDILLLDLMMPYIGGFEIMQQLKPIIPEGIYFPILVLTADFTDDTKLKALQGGATDFLSKPFDLYELKLRMENLLNTLYLNQQLDNQNQILEEKVQERTKELESTNKELIIARDKAEESDQLKTAFINNISHEIRTPLNGILGFAPFVIDPDITPEQKDTYLEILNTSSQRLMKTVNDMIDISQITTNNIEIHTNKVTIYSVLQEVFNSFYEASAKKNLEFKTQFPDDSHQFMLNTDVTLLKKVVSELVDNSIKFTPKGHIILGFDLLDTGVEIFVTDTGTGINKDQQQKIFKSFRQENQSYTRVYEGNGLGLTIAKGMIQLLGGELRLESIKGTGTKVFLTVPFSIKC